MQSGAVENEANLPYILTPEQAHDALTSSSSSVTSRSSIRTIPIFAAWFWPGEPRLPKGFTGLDSFTAHHIPHSLYWDFAAVVDTESQLPNMVPSVARLASAIHALGIVRTDRLIIHDSAELGLLTAPRVAWLLHNFGFPHVHILDNFHLWLQQGFPVESGPPPPPAEENHPQPFTSDDDDDNPVADDTWPTSTMVASFEDIRALSQALGTNSARAQLIDTRFASMFHGQEPDFIPNIPSGHVHNSLNVPWDQLLDPDKKGLRSAEELTSLFEACGVARERPAVSMCHVGIAAVLLDVALEKAGFGGKREGRRIFDGSYT
ncbi:hypothetical protein MMC29_003496 [Sticta canariensis]|nr:hypothetical protein [Sticta canariensis]